VNRAVLMELDAYTDHESLLNVALVGSTDHDEGVASFREKRSPEFTGG
jgi:enoyl-CoA hydratase/carnithine racemase